MGAEYLFYMKSIETHARAFLALIILGIGTVTYLLPKSYSRDETAECSIVKKRFRKYFGAFSEHVNFMKIR